MNGRFITFEGGEGAGKTTAIEGVATALIADGYEVVKTREPGGIRIAEQIRNIILDRDHIEMEGRTEALLYAAARRQHLVEKVIPALNAGKIVLCDRFIDSSLTYQGYARGIGMEAILTINEFAIEGCMPHLTLFLDLSPEEGLARIAANEVREKNRIDLEAISFHEKVYEGYGILLEKYPERIKRINAAKCVNDVITTSLSVIKNIL